MTDSILLSGRWLRRIYCYWLAETNRAHVCETLFFLRPFASDMGHDPDRQNNCSQCGGSGTRLDKKKVPGGADWYKYECEDCGHTWTT